jgi:hypothetical protein
LYLNSLVLVDSGPETFSNFNITFIAKTSIIFLALKVKSPTDNLHR